jgi:hypothetical protein
MVGKRPGCGVFVPVDLETISSRLHVVAARGREQRSLFPPDSYGPAPEFIQPCRHARFPYRWREWHRSSWLMDGAI